MDKPIKLYELNDGEYFKSKTLADIPREGQERGYVFDGEVLKFLGIDGGFGKVQLVSNREKHRRKCSAYCGRGECNFFALGLGFLVEPYRLTECESAIYAKHDWGIVVKAGVYRGEG